MMPLYLNSPGCQCMSAYNPANNPSIAKPAATTIGISSISSSSRGLRIFNSSATYFNTPLTCTPRLLFTAGRVCSTRELRSDQSSLTSVMSSSLGMGRYHRQNFSHNFELLDNDREFQQTLLTQVECCNHGHIVERTGTRTSHKLNRVLTAAMVTEICVHLKPP